MTLFDYILLLAGSFFAALISGSTGFGGALLLLPLLIKTFGTTMAVPLLTITQIIGNLSRVYMGWKEIQWPTVLFFWLGQYQCLYLDLYHLFQ